MNTIMKWLIIAGAALALFFASLWVWQHFHDNDQREEIGRLKGALREDSVQIAKDSVERVAASSKLDTSIAGTNQLIDRWHTRIIKEPIFKSAGDSLVYVQHLLAEARAHQDSVDRACSDTIHSCELFRITANQERDDLQRRYARLDSLYKVGPVRHRWSFGPGVSYGIGPDGKRGASLSVSVQRTILSW